MIMSQMDFPVLSRILLFIILILFPLSATAQRYSNVSLGSSIVADGRNSSWISPSGEFAFGFHQIVPGGGYLLAISFDKIPEKTIVWSANRNNPVEEGSKIQLSVDGSLELDNSRGQRIWAAKLVRSGVVAYGAMLDNGNFVLAQNTSAAMWQSFDEPTDTLLPAQVLNRGYGLISSFSETNYSQGRFRFILQFNGNLELQSSDSRMDNIMFTYWSVETSGSGFKLIFNQSGYIFLAAENGTVLNYLSSNGASTRQLYQRAILEYDGVLRHYVYPKSSNLTTGWSMGWSILDSLPLEICSAVLEPYGPGACGYNSYCSMGIDQRPICDCPDGYIPMGPNVRMSGCKPNFSPQNCDPRSQETELFTFSEMSNTNWVGADYAGFRDVNEDWCRQACLDDCFCAAIVYENRNCWKKRSPLSNGRIENAFRGKSLVKMRKNNATTTTEPSINFPISNKHKRSTLIITLSSLLGSSLFFLLVTSVLLFSFLLKRRKSNKLQTYSDFPGVNLKGFSFNELQEATNGFKEELGRGACSTVYKGTIKNENGKVVAVKKLNKIATEAEQEFKAEVSSISRTNHKNLVQLLGYCDEGSNRLLVYEFMSNGSLASFLFQNLRPSWYRRVQIALATARGLYYLHEECSTQIIHCDIKPQNVLLDESFTAKISDFGLAKLLRPDQTRTTTGIRGTRGYVAPEWFRNLPITVKVDVYSFGILLLEILCCRKNVETDVDEQHMMILADWAYDCYKEGTLNSLLAGDEEAMDDIKRFEKFIMISIWCIQEDPSLRPNMKRVMHMLEGAIEVPIPPDPESFIS